MKKRIAIDGELPEYFDGELLYLLSCLTDSEIAAFVPSLKFFIRGMLFASNRYTSEQLAEIEAAATKAAKNFGLDVAVGDTK